MTLQQINLRVEQGLVERLKAFSKQRGVSLNAIAATAFEQLLAGGQANPSSFKQGGLEDVVRRLEVLEQKVAKQGQQSHHLPHGPAALAASAPPPKQMNQLEALPDRRLTPQEAEGLLTGPQLCAALGLASESSFTNWIRRLGPVEAVGQVFHGHRLMGKGLLPGSAKPIWLWRKV